MEWVKTINNAIEYMENHLIDDITLGDYHQQAFLHFHSERKCQKSRIWPYRCYACCSSNRRKNVLYTESKPVKRYWIIA